MTRFSVSAADAAAAIAEAARKAKCSRVALAAGPAEPLALVDAWRAAPETASGLVFHGLFAPGANRTDYALLHSTARMEALLLNPDWRGGWREGRLDLLPIHYSAAYGRLREVPVCAAVFHVSTPDSDGLCSLGLAADSAPALLGRDDRFFRVGLVNRSMPPVASAPRIARGWFDLVVEGDWPLATLPHETPSDDGESIAARVAALVDDGDCIQIGIGRLPGAILAALKHKRGLRIHGGLVGQSIEPLIEAGALDEAPGAISVGIALGESDFYARIAREPRLRMIPVSQSHGVDMLSRLPNFVSINAALEVDVFGQVNAEFAGSRQIAGVGGMADFVRGAQSAPNGRAIIALAAEGKNGKSRIVPRLSAGAVTLSRADAPILVTPYGIADLRGCDVEARARAIIAIASPQHRPTLQDAWAEIRGRMT